MEETKLNEGALNRFLEQLKQAEKPPQLYRLKEIVGLFASQLEAFQGSIPDFPKTLSDDLDRFQKILARAPIPKILMFGTAKAGKSTFSNFLFFPDYPGVLPSLAGHAETTIPWDIFKSQEEFDQPFRVRTVSKDRQPHEWQYANSTRDLSLITSGYSRKKSVMGPFHTLVGEQLKPSVCKYSRIEIEYNPNLIKDNKSLYDAGICLVDLPGVNEFATKDIIDTYIDINPSIAVCCLNATAAQWDTTDLKIVQDLRSVICKAIFIVTNIKAALDQEKVLMPFISQLSPLDEESDWQSVFLIFKADVEKKIRGAPWFRNDTDSIFFFDPLLCKKCPPCFESINEIRCDIIQKFASSSGSVISARTLRGIPDLFQQIIAQLRGICLQPGVKEELEKRLRNWFKRKRESPETTAEILAILDNPELSRNRLKMEMNLRKQDWISDQPKYTVLRERMWDGMQVYGCNSMFKNYLGSIFSKWQINHQKEIQELIMIYERTQLNQNAITFDPALLLERSRFCDNPIFRASHLLTSALNWISDAWADTWNASELSYTKLEPLVTQALEHDLRNEARIKENASKILKHGASQLFDAWTSTAISELLDNFIHGSENFKLVDKLLSERGMKILEMVGAHSELRFWARLAGKTIREYEETPIHDLIIELSNQSNNTLSTDDLVWFVSVKIDEQIMRLEKFREQKKTVGEVQSILRSEATPEEIITYVLNQFTES